MKRFLPKSINNPKGFTLIELLIVVTIIAILAVIGVTVYAGIQTNARNARRRADVDSIQKALEVHFNTTTNQFCTAAAGTYCNPPVTSTWFSSGTRPTDPSTLADYAGLPVNGATTYNVCATLETPPGGTYCRANQQ